MKQIFGSLVVPLLVLIVTINVAADEPPWRMFRLPHEIEISIPRDWRLSNEQELRQYEAIAKKAIEAKGFTLNTGNAGAWVPFQAQKDSGSSAISAMISLIPGEISQDEIATWPTTQIERLVQFLAEAQRKGLIAAGSRDISIHSAQKIQAGGKTAIYFIMDFMGMNNRQYRAEKYFIYTTTRTVILTFQWTTQPSDFGRSEREGILASLRIR